MPETHSDNDFQCRDRYIINTINFYIILLRYRDYLTNPYAR